MARENYIWQPNTEIRIGDNVTIRTFPGSWKIVGISKVQEKARLRSNKDNKTIRTVPLWELDFRSRGK